MTLPLFHRLLGESFGSLPEPVKKLHDGRSKIMSGCCDVVRGDGLLSRLFGFVTQLPPAGKDQTVQVTIECDQYGEKWTRRFGKHSMRSSLSAQEDMLVEYLGPMRFKFTITVDHTQSIRWILAKVAVLGVPLPVRWFDQVVAKESVMDGNYCFDVQAALPMVGLLVHYQGWLNV